MNSNPSYTKYIETRRDITDYEYWLRMNLNEVINTAIATTGRNKLCVADSGCGEGRFLDSLLRTQGDKIACAYGISMHPLENLIKLPKKYDQKLIVHIGRFQNISSKLKEVDVLFDVFGAFEYSMNRFELLHMYYDCLSMGGVAKILVRTLQTWIDNRPLADFLMALSPACFSSTE